MRVYSKAPLGFCHLREVEFISRLSIPQKHTKIQNLSIPPSLAGLDHNRCKQTSPLTTTSTPTTYQNHYLYPSKKPTYTPTTYTPNVPNTYPCQTPTYTPTTYTPSSRIGSVALLMEFEHNIGSVLDRFGHGV